MSKDEYFHLVLKQLISEAARLLDLKKYCSDINTDVNKKDGFLSTMTRIKLEADGRTFSLIAKFAPRSLKFRTELPIRGAFEREIFFYKTIIPIFKELQLNIKNPFDAVTRSYSYSTEEFYEAILFDDLLAGGYQMWDYKKPMNEEHISFVLSTYGKLHSLSFAYKRQNPEEFAQKFKHLRKSLFNQQSEHEILNMTIKQCELAEKGFDPVVEKEDLKILTAFKDSVKEFVYGIENQDQKYFALLHGDCWCNNMMFSYDSPEKTSPSKMRLLDWQILNIGPPICDISYFFYTNASPEMYNEYLERYKTIYYDSLCEHLHALGEDASDLYPRVVFEDQWRKFCRFGLIMGLSFINLNEFKDNLKSHEELGEATFAETCLKAIEDVGNFHEMAKPFIKHFIQNGFI